MGRNPTRSLFPLADVAVGARFLWSLPGFLRNPISPEQARAILSQRLQRREAGFLEVIRRGIYPQASSVYRRLLAIAGCQYGDVERLVSHEGVEGALETLYGSGVYLTVEELKGRRAVVRGSAEFVVDPGSLCNPRSNVHLTAQTSGSRGGRTPVPVDLAIVRQWAVNKCLVLEARDGLEWLQAAWYVPGGDAIAYLLLYSAIGASPVRWFSQIDPASPGLHPRYRWSARALHWGTRLAGVPMPRPQYVPVDEPLPIARWIADVLAAGRTPHLVTYASPAVRLCQAASEAGLDLRGAQFLLVGESVTTARLAFVRRVGVNARSSYSSIEAGPIGESCLEPEAADEVHVYRDLVALIQPQSHARHRATPDGGLFVSSVHPEAPLVLLNVSMGDEGVLRQRRCGCPLQQLGWTTHLHTIRSFEKLTAGGMTLLDTEVIRVLEEVLPARFGGGPTDYQLVEQDGENGRPALRLLVHPRLGSLDSAAIAETFLAAIGRGAGAQRIMALQWRQNGLPRVERQVPLATTTGKILHVHRVGSLTAVDSRRTSDSS
jgi:hypothetical protein